MSHHYSGPDFGFPRGDARLDFTDLYAFPKPSNATKSILVMNVHPSAVVNPPGPTTAEPFAPEALYEFKIDTNGDVVADIAYRVRFSVSQDGSQIATLRRVQGAQAAEKGRGRPSYLRISTGLDGSGRSGDGGRRVSLLRWLAQRSLFLGRAWYVEPPAVHWPRFLRR